MKRMILGMTAAAAVALTAGQAMADGINSSGRIAATEGYGPNWNGFYLGVGVGGVATVTDVEGYGVGFDGIGAEGVLGTVTVGFDRVLRPGWVGGLFANYDFSNASTDIDTPLGNASIDQNYSWAVGARLGYLVNPATLLYGTAGYTQTEFELDGVGSQQFDGYFVGAGYETFLRDNWTLKLEYRYAQYDSEDLGSSGISVEPSEHSARLVLSYKFGDSHGRSIKD